MKKHYENFSSPPPKENKSVSFSLILKKIDTFLFLEKDSDPLFEHVLKKSTSYILFI
ncbi:MAG: hypothetical protein ACI4UK_02300 [Floccifex sp.]